MNKLNNKSGFTLIEIIVVLIIVGILAAIALPNLFSNIQKSKGAQALTLLDSYKTMTEGYLQQQGTLTPTSGTALIASAGLVTAAQNGWSITVGPSTSQGALVGTVVAPQGNAQGSSLQYGLVATDGSSNTIVLNRSTGGTWSCSIGSASPYSGDC